MDEITAPPPAATPTARPVVDVRPLRADDEPHVRRIFRETIAMGAPAVLPPAELTRYEQLCLGWYLANPQHSLTVVEDGAVRGYLLACLDERSQSRWATRHAIRWGVGAAGRILAGRARGDARRFVWHRVRDGVAMVRNGPTPPYPAHAHVNLDPQLRGVSVGHRLLGMMDETVADAGLDGWYGEMNWPAGTSPAAVEAAGAVVVHRQRNHTLSWLTGQDVERATVARPLARRTDSWIRRTAA